MWKFRDIVTRLYYDGETFIVEYILECTYNNES